MNLFLATFFFFWYRDAGQWYTDKNYDVSKITAR